MPAGATGGQDRPEGALDAELEAFDRFATALVRLEPFTLDEVRVEVRRFAAAVEHHLRASRPHQSRTGSSRSQRPAIGGRLDREHERFRTSVEELRLLLQVVERDDHGGHRQALGQYGRIFVEALRLHRGDERLPAVGDRAGTPPTPRA